MEDNLIEAQPEAVEPALRNRVCRRRYTRYMWDFLVVVAGIAVSFAVSGWINSVRERKQLDTHMQAVRTELERNLEMVSEMEKYYDATFNLAIYLCSKQRNEHNADSIYTYETYKGGMSVIDYSPTLTYASSSYETLKSSGMMNMLRNQDLSRQIVECYKLLGESKQESDHYISMKMAAMYESVMENNITILGTDILTPGMEKYYYFMAVPFGLTSIVDCRRQIEATLSMFEKQ